MDNIKQPLLNLGFTDKEANIYMALLELGSTSYTGLAKASGIKRTSLYAIIEQMQERGVVRYETDRRRLAPTLPEDLFRQLQANTLQFHRLIPQLKELGKKQRSISRVQFFTGKEGIKRAYLERDAKKLPLKKDRIIRVISDSTTWESFWKKTDPNFTENYLKDAKAKGFSWKVLASGSGSVYSLKRGQEYNFVTKILPPEYTSEFDMEIHGTHIIIADLKSEQPYAIKIISTELATALTNFFEFAWNLYLPT